MICFFLQLPYNSQILAGGEQSWDLWQSPGKAGGAPGYSVRALGVTVPGEVLPWKVGCAKHTRFQAAAFSQDEFLLQQCLMLKPPKPLSLNFVC